MKALNVSKEEYDSLIDQIAHQKATILKSSEAKSFKDQIFSYPAHSNQSSTQE
jgi:hypothetical protein